MVKATGSIAAAEVPPSEGRRRGRPGGNFCRKQRGGGGGGGGGGGRKSATRRRNRTRTATFALLLSVFPTAAAAAAASAAADVGGGTTVRGGGRGGIFGVSGPAGGIGGAHLGRRRHRYHQQLGSGIGGQVGLASLPNLAARSAAAAVRQASLQSHVDVATTAVSPPSVRSSSPTAVAVAVPASSSVRTKRRRANNSGFYYGIREDIMLAPREEGRREAEPPPPPGDGQQQRRQQLESTPQGQKRKPSFPGRSGRRPPHRHRSGSALTEIMGETLLELREMREEIFALREEMRVMKQQMWSADGGDEGLEEDEFDAEEEERERERERSYLAEAEAIEVPEHHEHPQPHGIGGLMARRKRHKAFEKIGHEVERWAERLLFEEDAEGDEEGAWKEIQCNRVVRTKYNSEGRIKCYLKWMKDSREEHAKPDDDGRTYPCLKIYATIDAPMEDVCDYLSRQEHMREYNELVCAHRDLEEITPHSKITWAQIPKILFVNPRDFVTYCHHRWKKDGSLVIVNQATDHEDAPAVEDDKGGKVCRAFALRGANYISKDPEDPENKTRYYLLAHADPGGGLPQWACKSAVNAVAPIEPFKLFHNIEACVKRKGPPPPHTGFASALPGRSSKPAGLSQMGYACFWPKGGGLKDHHSHQSENSEVESSGEKDTLIQPNDDPSR